MNIRVLEVLLLLLNAGFYGTQLGSEDDGLRQATLILGILMGHETICPSTPFCNPRTDSHFLPVPCCEFCSSEFDQGSPSNCCPKSIPEDYADLLKQRRDIMRTCTGLSLKYPSNGTYMFSSCPKHTEEQLAYNCTTDEIKINLSEIVPVTHRSSGDIYKNMYCALCNAVALNEVEMWRARMECKEFTGIGYEEVTAFLENNDCDIIFETIPEPPQEIAYCTVIETDMSLCNQSGLWKEYSEGIEYACNFYVSAVIIPSRRRKYRNIFCALCDGWEDFTDIDCFPDTSLHINDTPAYSALLDPNIFEMELNAETQSNCPRKHIYDRKKDICIMAQCSILRRLEGETCQLAMKDINVFTYEAVFRLVPKFEITLENGFLLVPSLTRVLGDGLFKAYSKRHCLYKIVLAVNWNDEVSIYSRLRFIDLKMICVISDHQDPEQIHKNIFNKDFINFDLFGNVSYTFTIYTRDASDVLFTNWIDSDGITYWNLVNEIMLTNRTIGQVDLTESLRHRIHDPILKVTSIPFLVVKKGITSFIIIYGINLLSLAPCPMTLVTKEEYPWHETIKGLMFTEQNIHLNSWHYYYEDGNRSTVMLCMDIYRQITEVSGCGKTRVSITSLLTAVLITRVQ